MQNVIGATLIAATALATTAALAEDTASTQHERLVATFAQLDNADTPLVSVDAGGVATDILDRLGLTGVTALDVERKPLERAGGHRWEQPNPGGR